MFRRKRPTTYPDRSTPRICIIGAGLGGLCQAIQLKRKLGVTSFDIIDRSHDFGGVWLQNIYPGCAVDIPGYYYCLSFEQNPSKQKIVFIIKHGT